MKEVKVEETGERARSSSFGSSFRRLFSPKSSTTTTRRGGSLNRPAPASQLTVTRESSVPTGAAAAPTTKDTLSPFGLQSAAGPGTSSLLRDGDYQRQQRQGTPVPPPSRDSPAALQLHSAR